MSFQFWVPTTALFGAGKLNEPVSYTHLDVYKRHT